MYMAYGWPLVIPIDPGSPSSFPDNNGIVFMKVANRLLLVVVPERIELWSASHHKIRLGKFARDPDSIESEGVNSQAAWSPDGKTISVMTSSWIVHIYKIHFSGKRIVAGGKQPHELFLANISLVITEKAPFSVKSPRMSNFVCDNKSLLLGLPDGFLQVVSWNGEFARSFQPVLGPFPFQKDAGLPNSVHTGCTNSAILQLEFSLFSRFLAIVYFSGQVALCSTSKKGIKQVDSIKFERWLAVVDAVCASIASEQPIIAIGCRRGVVELFDLADNVNHLRTVSLFDWGYAVEHTGPVTCISWTPDNCAFAVGWKHRGLAVWSLSGCRLMCTIRQIGVHTTSSPLVKPHQELKFEPLMGGTRVVHWDDFGYKLYAVEEGSERILAFSFGKYCLNRGLSGTTYARQVIYGEDRVLVVEPDDNDELKMLHLNLPVSYISQNWPVLHVVSSKDGMYLAVAGLHGLILYDLRIKKWRVFGDVSQEQKIQCRGLLWLGKIIIVCNYIESSNTYELLFFPRYHLDQSSLLYRKPLLGKPIVMDVFQDYILVTYHPFNVHIFHVKVVGELSPTSTPVLLFGSFL